MADIIKSKNDKYELYEARLLQRDTVAREAGAILTAYIKEFGQLITDSFKIKVECIELKKSIAFCQSAINRGEKPSHNKMNEYIVKVMKDYYEELDQMVKEHEKALKSKVSTPEMVIECKQIYRKIAKAIHPDLHPDFSKEEKIMELWSRAVDAYGANNLKELQEILVLVNSAVEQLGLGEIEVEIPNIEQKISDIEKEIEHIKTTEPYTYKDILEDEVAIEGKKTELELEIKEFENYKKELEEVMAAFEFEEGEPCQMS